MKPILIIIISFCCVQGIAQNKDQVPVDTLLSVPLSKVRFCVAKAEEANFLKERVLVKDQQIELANNIVEGKNKEIGVLNGQLYSVESQRDINAGIIVKKDELLNNSGKEITHLKKQNVGLKIGLVVSWALLIIVAL
jgi:hypothetical protein